MATAGYRVILDQPNLSRFTIKQIDDAIRKVKAELAAKAAKKSPGAKPRGAVGKR